MRKHIIFSLMLFAAVKGYSQDYLISFAGNGASTTFDSVKVENLAQNKSITIPGGNQLRLKAIITGINFASDETVSSLRIYPNPTKEYCIVELDALRSGIATIEIINLSGVLLAQMQSYLVNGKHSYSISGLGSGVYIVSVKSEDYINTGKIISQSDTKGDMQISYNDKLGELENKNANKLKSTQAETAMQYTAGDRLMLIGISGNYRTILTDIPTESKTITFNFVSCTDGDNNNYPVVKIDTQIWMAEDLKTTKYNNNTGIPLVTDDIAWASLTTPAYCWYNNDSATYKSIYGALYNCYTLDIASNGGKNVCPTGWHVPTDAEWKTLTDYLGGESVAGGKLKETNTIHWHSPNTSATNETGFTALPGGDRYVDGTFYNLGYYCFWWSATESYTVYAWRRTLGHDYSSVYRINDAKELGCSVRCVRD